MGKTGRTVDAAPPGGNAPPVPAVGAADAPFTAPPPWRRSGCTAQRAICLRSLPLPDGLPERLTATADDLGVSPRALLLAAQARVVSALTGERTVVVGARGLPPCRLDVADAAWGSLAREADRHLTAARDRGPHVPRGEDVDGPPLWVALDPDGATLSLTHRTDLYDTDYADRVAGYHLAALDALTTAPEAPAGAAALISDAELALHLHGQAGERLDLPELGFHELFEERARATPDAPALCHEGRTWTYRELDHRANSVAHTLLAAGLAREDIVAVITPRTLEWVAAALGVFKAGGAYLPIDPGFPAERIGRILEISGARHALTTEEGDLPVPVVLRLDEAAACARPDSPGLAVRPDQLAYLYFTSGSTGSPKGVMCEHAGMVNHLLAKIRDLEIDRTSVVVQSASQCFDISLWQFAAPLMVGGRSLLVGQERIMDVADFAAALEEGGATVLQLVPSYLDALLTHLEHRGGGLGAVRYVSVTGEAISKELVGRWFARTDVPLVNAYGATEASDDTTHEIMRGVPASASVPIGRPVHNVRVYVLDEDLALVPLGAPGQIAFSGVAVGRGYVNDPERTRTVFVEDPYLPGQRLYLTGDYGRWSADGHLEFLGRRDQQVKIRGFRVEIGEIEERLRRMPGVRDAAVVVEHTGERTKNLAAFYASDELLPIPDLEGFLGAVLPRYMVPSHFHRLDPLPLTENGKTDRKALAALAGALGHETGTHVAPGTPVERQLADAWAEVLGVAPERIGRDSDFFRLGGSSLEAVRLVVRLERRISLTDVVGSPVLADMAAHLDAGGGTDDRVLHRLSTGRAGAVATLVCLPPAAGNAVNFRPLARALEDAGLAVHGVEPPGHDLRRGGQDLASLEELARRTVRELDRLVRGPVVLYGHGAGAVAALATAALLQARGTAPRHVLLSGWAPSSGPGELRERLLDVAGADDDEILDRLSADLGYVELGADRAERVRLLGAAYRHDESEALRYLLDSLDGASGPPVTSPVTVLVPRDDRGEGVNTAALTEWKRLADTVAPLGLTAGAHHFRVRPEEIASAIISLLWDGEDG